jgi:CubicO group peptidase (beta-lactamase class C family)
MLRYIFGFLFFVTSVFGQETSRMDQIVEYYVSNGQFMGSVLVALDKEVVFSKSYGSANLEWNTPNTSATKFRLGSITKQFTAAAILLLEERGKLSIQDPVKKYLPDYPAAWDRIKIFHVLTHTSGIPSITDSPEYSKLEPFPLTPAQNLEKIRDKPLEFAPGERYKYSNSGYILLGFIIEKASGQTYQDFIQKNIFTPLNMNDSGYDSNFDIIPHRASGYSPGAHGPQNAGFIHMSIPFSAGALYSTTEDLLKWEQGLLCGKLLSADSLEKMTTPFKGNYGFGLQIETVEGKKRISHGGAIEGFNTYLAYYPEDKLTVAVLANLNGSAPQLIGDKLAALAHGKAVVLPSERREIALSPEILARYVGAYKLQPGVDLVFTLEDNQLFAQITGQPKFPLFPESETRFFLKVVDASVEFLKNDQGIVTHAVIHQGANKTKVARIGDEANDRSTAEINGAWVGIASGPEGKPLEITYVFEAAGDSLVGTVSTALGGGPFSEGKIEGNKISFVSKTDQFTIQTTGILSGDRIEITQTAGDQSQKFTVKRVSAVKQ